MFRQKTIGLLIALILPLAGCSRGGQDCPPAPVLVPSVGGQSVGPRQMSGNGVYCGAIGDGVAFTSLEAVPAAPGAEVRLTYETNARWDTVTYTVALIDVAVKGGKLADGNLSFKLPNKPGTYTVGFRGESGHGHSSTYFRVRIAEPEPEAYLYPDVPVHPAAQMSDLISEQRGAIRVGGNSRAEIMAWYSKQLPARGWRAEPTPRSPDQVLLFSKAGQYVRLSAHLLSRSGGAIIWFHLRPTPKVTSEQAIAIAQTSHNGDGEWIATYQSEYQGVSTSHPVWMVEVKPGNDAVWVDAITAEVLTIRE